MNKLHLLSAVALSVVTAKAAEENLLDLGAPIADPLQVVVERNPQQRAAIDEHGDDAAPLLEAEREEDDDEEDVQPAIQPEFNFVVPAVAELLDQRADQRIPAVRFEEIGEEEEENADDHNQEEFDVLGGPVQEDEQAILQEQQLQRQRQLLTDAAEERRIREEDMARRRQAAIAIVRGAEQDLGDLGFGVPGLANMIEQEIANLAMAQQIQNLGFEGEEAAPKVGEIIKIDGVRHRWNGSKFVRL